MTQRTANNFIKTPIPALTVRLEIDVSPNEKVKVGETYEVTHDSNSRPGTQSIFAGICVANGEVSATFEIVEGNCRSDRDGYRVCGQNVRLSHSSFQVKQISEAISDLDSDAHWWAGCPEHGRQQHPSGSCHECAMLQPPPDPPRRRRRTAQLADALESSAQKIRERLEHK